MPKRYGKHRTWLNKMRRKYCPPEIVAFHRAFYNPYFKRSFYALARCRQGPQLPFEFIDQAEYCLDGIQET